MGGWLDGWIDVPRNVDGWVDGWMDGWMDVPKNEIKQRKNSNQSFFSKDDIHNNNSDECHLCFISFLGTPIHPSIHPSIHLVSHPLFNMSMAPFNNPPDQSVSFLASPFLRGATDWSGGLLKFPFSVVGSLVHKLFTPSIHPSIHIPFIRSSVFK
jgi:hypothetical protein